MILDRNKSDASAALDLMRALAAQTVCIGHAVNLAGIGLYTTMPSAGVVVFFLISGFVIAYTLAQKSVDPTYGPIEFGIDRFARIYTAYLPALLLIAALDWAMQFPDGSRSMQTFLGNLIMRENLPGWPSVTTFGSAGHLTSVALEFHIYLFVGAAYFLFRGRNVLLCLALAFAFFDIPLAFTAATPGTDRSLFIVWLAGFAAYYIASVAEHFRTVRAAMAFLTCLTLTYWFYNRTGAEAELQNVAPLGVAFICLMTLAQFQSTMSARATSVIRFFSDYSYSLFLIHLTIVKIVYTLPMDRRLLLPFAILLANALAIGFAFAFERHYRGVARFIKAQISAGAAISSLRRQSEPSP